MKWNPQQEKALSEIQKWYRDKTSRQWYYLSGYAGTGKTTLAKHIQETLNVKVGFGAYTGKAALVLKNSGCRGATTIHSMIYVPEVDEKTGIVTFRRKSRLFPSYDLLIIDEVSMVDKTLALDLLSYGVKILVLGDPGQLPPVSGSGYFTKDKPNMVLTEIHRQAKENPIIWMATRVREGKTLKPGWYGESKVEPEYPSIDEMMQSSQVIVGTNRMRQRLNETFRKRLGFGTPPEPNDKLICTKNNHDVGILNGEMFKIHDIMDHMSGKDFYRIILEREEYPGSYIESKVHKGHLNFDYDHPSTINWRVLQGSDSFDYGYTITCHKSQGSQYETVHILDESGAFRDQRYKWLYTALTRAQERVTISGK